VICLVAALVAVTQLRSAPRVPQEVVETVRKVDEAEALAA
jgi:hypothetical protein